MLYKCQFGFRQNYCTSVALTYQVENILSHVQNGDYVIGVFMDFSKAFDTVNHNVLLNKLENYDTRGIASSLLESYLSERKQFVHYQLVTQVSFVSMYHASRKKFQRVLTLYVKQEKYFSIQL